MTSEPKLTREQFFAQLTGRKLAELRQICADDKLLLQSTSKDSALAEMWAHYTGVAPMKPINAPASPLPPAPLSAAPVRYEARLSRDMTRQGSRAVYRLGRAFTQAWQDVTAEEAERLKDSRHVVECRIKG